MQADHELQLAAAAELAKALSAAVKRRAAEPEVAQLRVRLRGAWVAVLFGDWELASRRGVETQIWRVLFHRVIEELREKIRKCKSAASKASGGQQASAALGAFLSEASAFYEGLLQRLAGAFGLELGNLSVSGVCSARPLSSPRLAAAPWPAGYASCHRCLICLGDLARYSAMLAPGRKDYSTASLLYQHAAWLMPDSGNPHNQLAVLATYSSDTLGAAVAYVRSVLSVQPFETAPDNLALLFDRNRKELDALGPNKASAAGSYEHVVSRFTTRFMRAHGVLHSRGAGLDGLDALVDSIVQDMRFLVQRGALGENTLLKLLTLNISTTFQVSVAAVATDSSPVEDSGTELHCAAFALACRTFGVAVEWALGQNLAIGEPPPLMRFLGLFIDWLAHDGVTYMDAAVFASLEWLGVAPAVASVLAANDAVAVPRHASELAMADGSRRALPEDFALQGFAPLTNTHAELCFEPYSAELARAMQDGGADASSGAWVARLQAVSGAAIYGGTLSGNGGLVIDGDTVRVLPPKASMPVEEPQHDDVFLDEGEVIEGEVILFQPESVRAAAASAAEHGPQSMLVEQHVRPFGV